MKEQSPHIKNESFSTLKQKLGKLQYISQGVTPDEHLENIKKVCEAGVDWVQLRLKNVDIATYLNAAIECRKICDRYEAILMINDQVEVAKAIQADGVHLGLKDMNIKDARKILGDHYIIGGTANTLEDCLYQAKKGADYIGLGPFRFTETKQKLSPVLGFEGYKKIVSKFRLEYPELPIVAIGGIQSTDIEELLKTGISGIAVSGMLTGSSDLQEKVKYIDELMINSE